VSPPVAIDLRHLRYFLAVFEELHFGRAAERLHIAQPPLSQAIRKVENELGVQLFHRTSRLVIATESGKAFAEEARKVLAAFDLAVAEARRAGGAPAVIRVGCSPFLPIERLDALLTAIREREPGLTTRVTHLGSPEQRRRLIRGDLDVGIFQPASDVAGLMMEPVFPGEPLAAFLSPGHRLATKARIRPEDVSGETLVVYPRPQNPALHDRFYGFIESEGFQFRNRCEAGGTSGRDLILAALQGHGVLLAASSLKDVAGAGELVVRRPIAPQVTTPDWVISWRVKPPSQLARVLYTFRAVAREFRAGAEERSSRYSDDPDMGRAESIWRASEGPRINRRAANEPQDEDGAAGATEPLQRALDR
jgi:DNA-binding transcriptional LysR family regulator